MIGYFLGSSDKYHRLNFEGHGPQFPVPKVLSGASAPEADCSTLNTFCSGCSVKRARMVLGLQSSSGSLNLTLVTCMAVTCTAAVGFAESDQKFTV